MYTKICEMCGKEFQTKTKSKRFCNEPHFVKCCICGKLIKVPNDNVAYYFKNKDTCTCPGKCRGAYINRNTTHEQRAQKIRDAMMKKFGVENPGQLQSTIEKREQTSLQRYGTKHASQSAEAIAKRKQTCLEKYGVEHVTQSQEFKDKSKETCLEKYGVEFATQSQEFQEKATKSMIERYGVAHALQSPEILERRKQTNIQRYGAPEVWQSEEVRHKIQETSRERYGVDNPTQSDIAKQHSIESCQEKYGVDYYLQSDDCKEKTKISAQKKYGVDHHLQAPEVMQKRIQTCIEKYGSENIFGSEYGMKKIRETMFRKYGVANPSQYEEFKCKAARNARNSKLELRIIDLFVNYDITFVHHYFLSDPKENISHEFDFYLPKYKILIDADGLYFHSYLNDPNGKQSLDYYDDIRMKLVPEDHQFYLIVEGNEDSQVKQIVKILEQIDAGIFNYDSYLFDWCRSINFPYPSYTEKRMIHDWTYLCKYQNSRYVPTCRSGESIIKQFHKSIYSCRVKTNATPLEAWYDDTKLKKVIKNRLIYVNDVDPSKILRGFNVSKICPVVSMFNPILAKYIVTKYLSEFSTVFDPFSGFSGRLLGVASTQKKYIGQDLNEKVVEESNQIIKFLNLSDQCSVGCKDIFESEGQYECLLTCPPYDKKETYNHETVFQSCDKWIDECLTRFKCKRYAFVVDETEKYSQYVVEELKSSSHFTTVTERIVIIDGIMEEER